MSFLSATPELVTAAAGDLADIRSALSEASATAAAPTTGVLAAGADEVSAAISQLFGAYGQEFQVLSAEAAAFHDNFVSLLSSGGAAYLSTEAANVQQVLLNGMSAPAQALGAAGAPATLNSFAAAVEAPYQTLVSNTTANLQALRSAISADPAPFLNQLATNDSAFAQTIATGFQSGIQNLPAELANLPADFQAGIQGVLTANPAAALQGFVDQQNGYAQLINTSLHNAGNDFVTGLNALPASFQAANQAFAVGDVTGGVELIGGGFLNPVFTGLDVSTLADGTLSITPLGAVGDLLPILSIPGQMAQNFTNMLPAGSIPAQVAQHFTNLINIATDTSTTSSLTLIADPGPVPTGEGFGLDLDTHMGLPLALAIDAIGGPVNGLNALSSSASAFVNAVQTGDPLGAATAFLDAPAAFANGFLDGQTTLPLHVTALGFPTTLNLPLSGILVNPAPYFAVADAGGGFTINGVVTGTPLGGLVPALLNFLPQELASALGAPAPVIPNFPSL